MLRFLRMKKDGRRLVMLTLKPVTLLINPKQLADIKFRDELFPFPLETEVFRKDFSSAFNC